MFEIWDGLDFFSFDTYKLERHREKQDTSWTDKLRNWQWVLISLVILIGTIVLLYSDFNKLGSIKSYQRIIEPGNYFVADVEDLHVVTRIDYQDISSWVNP